MGMNALFEAYGGMPIEEKIVVINTLLLLRL